MKNIFTKAFFLFLGLSLIFNVMSAFKNGILHPLKPAHPAAPQTQAQSGIKYDTIIKTKAYTSYFSKSLHVPVIVSYKLYKGGGDCFSTNLAFKNDIKSLWTATDKDYTTDTYFKAHLACYQDFSYDCKIQESCFRYYNCIPMTEKLYRGFWKYYEKEVRKLSQTDSLLIICCNTFEGKTMGTTEIAVPKACYKFVYSLTDWSLMINAGFTNEPTPQKIPVPLKLADDIRKTVTGKN